MMSGTLSRLVTGSTDDRVTTMPTTRSASLRTASCRIRWHIGQGHHRERAAHPQVQERRPILVDGDLARPVGPWHPAGQHLGYVNLVPEPPVGGHLGDPTAGECPGWLDVQ